MVASVTEEQIKSNNYNENRGSTWSYSLPHGPPVHTYATVDAYIDEPGHISLTGEYTHRTVWSLNAGYFQDSGTLDYTSWTRQQFAGLDGPVLALGYLELGLNPTTGQPVVKEALECALTFCVREYDRSVIEGTLVSNIVSTHYGLATTHSFSSKPGPIPALDWSAQVNGSTFVAAADNSAVSLPLTAWCVHTGNTTNRYVGDCEVAPQRSSNEVECLIPASQIEPVGNCSTLVCSTLDFGANFTKVVENVGQVLTDIIQEQGNIQIKGQAFRTVVQVSVRWGWVVYPAALLCLANTHSTLHDLRDAASWNSRLEIVLSSLIVSI